MDKLNSLEMQGLWQDCRTDFSKMFDNINIDSIKNPKKFAEALKKGLIRNA